ncbi:heme-binding protein [Candidatus Saccharibacteria bacterium]|nr:MAG: heme-binding protein [Candidatus Saccharibacteria bacterium]
MKYINMATVSYETAAQIVDVAISEGKNLDVAVSVAVVDLGLNLVAFGKADGATTHSIETSRRKANTSASTKKETGWMSEDLEIKLPLGADNLLTNIPGGHPIVFDGKVVGGFGIAGGTVEQDAQVAEAVKTKIGSE